MANMEYINNYEKENLRQIRLKINRKTEPELLEWIEKQKKHPGIHQAADPRGYGKRTVAGRTEGNSMVLPEMQESR